MTRRFLPAVVCTLAFAGCSSAPPPPEVNAAADIAAINSVRSRFVAAYNSGDAAAMATLYTADAVSEPNNQPSLIGRDAIIASQTAMFEQVSAKLNLQAEETQTQGNAGFDRGRYAVQTTPKSGGPATTTEGRYLVLLVKESDGGWKVARDMDNLVAGPSPAAPETPPATTP